MNNTSVERWQALVVTSGRQVGRSVTVGDSPVVIGCSPECDLVVEGHGVARRHAELFRAQRAIFVRDLGSGNDTLLNGEPIPGPVRVEAGDTIGVADLTLSLGVVSTIPQQRGAGALSKRAPVADPFDDIDEPGQWLISAGMVVALLGSGIFLGAEVEAGLDGRGLRDVFTAEVMGVSVAWAGVLVFALGALLGLLGLWRSRFSS